MEPKKVYPPWKFGENLMDPPPGVSSSGETMKMMIL